MIAIHLLVEEDYIEELMQNLPKDKVKIVEENFKENKVLLENSLDDALENENDLTPYNETIKNINDWLSTRESK